MQTHACQWIMKDNNGFQLVLLWILQRWTMLLDLLVGSNFIVQRNSLSTSLFSHMQY
jgi:hypothetical protein